MPNLEEQWKDWYSGTTDPPSWIAGVGNFWLNTVTQGVWEKVTPSSWVLRGYLTDPNFLAGLGEVEFVASDWDENRIVVIPTGTPTHGEIGPHLIPPRRLWPRVMQKCSSTNEREVEVGINFNMSNGEITIYRASKVPPFDGTVAILFKLK